MNYLTWLLSSSLLAAAPASAPCISQFSASRTQLDAGQPVTLTWTLTGGAPASLTLEDDLTGARPVNLLGKASLGLREVVRRQTFTLKARNAQGSSQATLTLAARGLSLLAGAAGGSGSLDGLQGAAGFLGPSGLALDGSGYLLVADTWNSTIRRVSPGGRVSTLAGQAEADGDQDGRGAAARFKWPEGIAVDGSTGVIYVADTGNDAIRSIARNGDVSTIAGAAGQRGCADGLGPAARFDEPRGLAVGADGTLYVADSGNHLIRRISPTDGSVTTLAGTAGTWGFQDGAGTSAQFGYPWGLALDAEQNLLVADTFNNAIRRISGGVVTTLAGGPDRHGSRDGTLATACFDYPMAIVARPDGSLLVCDSGDGRIRTVDGNGVGTCALGADQPLREPAGMVLDAAGAILVADTGGNAIRRFAPGGAGTTLAGNPGAGQGGLPSAAKVVVEPLTGAVWLADGGGAIRRVSPRGQLEPLALQSAQAQAASLKGLKGLTVDGSGSFYAVNGETSAILRISPDGLVSVLVGPPGTVSGDGLMRPLDLAMDSGGNLFITDGMDATVRKLAPDGTLTLFAGTPFAPGSRDGLGAEAQFGLPAGIAVAGGDTLIVADAEAHTIRRISPLGQVTTLAGKAFESGCQDGPGAQARFKNPQGVTVDAFGNLFVADAGNATVRKITPEGMVSTVAGSPGQAGGLMGPLPGGLSQPHSVAVTPAGDLLVLCENGLVQVTQP